MTHKNLLMTALLLAGLSPLASAKVFTHWEQTTGSYELDGSKTACIARTKIRNQHLTFNFPKDGIGFPIVKVTNLTRTSYLGAMTRIGNIKFQAFAHEIDGKDTHYFVPKSVKELESFITYVRDQSVLEARLYLGLSGKLRYERARFSLSGSTAATDALKSCLGGQLISNSQKSLIKVLGKYKDSVSAQRRTLDVNETLFSGSRIYQALRDVNADGHLFEPLERSLSEQENNPRYHELKRVKNTQNEIVRRESNISATLLDNQRFYGQADSIISNLRAKITSEKNRLISLTEQKRALVAKIDSANARISVLQVDVNNASRVVESTRSRLYQSQSELREQEERLRRLNNNIASLRSEINRLESQSANLQDNFSTASRRYVNRDQIRVRREREIEQRFGSTRGALEESIAENERKYQRKTARVQKASKISKQASNIVNTLSGINDIKEKIAVARSKIQELKPNRKDPKVQKKIENLKGRIANLKSKRDDKLAKAAAIIGRIELPNNAGANFSSAKNLKQCTPTLKATCINKANNTVSDMNALVSQLNSQIGDIQGQLTVQRQNLSEMDSALSNLNGLEERLRRQRDQAESAYLANEQAIANNRSSLRNNRSRKQDVSSLISSLVSQVDREQRRLASAESDLRAAQSVIVNFKQSVNYNGMLAQNRTLAENISTTQRSLNNNQGLLSSTLDRQQRISQEIHTYPTRIATAQQNEAQAQAVLNRILPEFNKLDSSLRNTRREYERVFSNVSQPLKTFQTYYKTVIQNLL